MSIKLEQLSSYKQFGGHNRRFKHDSTVLGCKMTFSVYLPPTTSRVPVLFYLSGLTCTDENFIQKSGAQRRASELGVALVSPDTSPRGLNLPGEADAYDFGVGAGFYLNATQEPWAKHWRMHDYITQELPSVLAGSDFGAAQLDLSRVSVMGHSMGGHGALTLALRNPGMYKSVSAFAPISNPTKAPWGIKAFKGYLGEDQEAWKQHDACELLSRAPAGSVGPAALPLLVDVGSGDSNLDTQLGIDALRQATSHAGYGPDVVRLQEGYDHSYFFISTFVDDHVTFHSQHLRLEAAGLPFDVSGGK